LSFLSFLFVCLSVFQSVSLWEVWQIHKQNIDFRSEHICPRSPWFCVCPFPRMTKGLLNFLRGHLVTRHAYIVSCPDHTSLVRGVVWAWDKCTHGSWDNAHVIICTELCSSVMVRSVACSGHVADDHGFVQEA